VKEWQTGFLRAFHAQFGEVADALEQTKAVSDEIEAKLRSAITDFNATWN
jgi:hypothetical protein